MKPKGTQFSGMGTSAYIPEWSGGGWMNPNPPGHVPTDERYNEWMANKAAAKIKLPRKSQTRPEADQ